MAITRTLLYLAALLICCRCSILNNNGKKSASKQLTCPAGDGICEKDRLGYEAIAHLHSKLDDDSDGSIDVSESTDFLRDELQYTDGKDRQTSFHGNDKMISVDDLWKQWKHSEVYNWTVDDVSEWLVVNVDLPQYVDNFRVNAVDGTVLPRLAANNNHYLSGIIGIKNQVHKRKLNLKAVDVVLFGGPKRHHSFLKDTILVASIAVAVGGCWYAYVQQKHSKSSLKKMMQDLDNLQTAENSLMNLQQQLSIAQQEQQNLIEEKEKLEATTKDEILAAKVEAERLKMTRETTQTEMNRLRLAEQELDQVRNALRKSEYELERRAWAPSEQLQQWLQLTYEIELANYNTKKSRAEKQLQSAKDACERLRRKRQAFMGSFRVAHSSSEDDIEHIILTARTSLEEVRHDLQERLHRWQCIEQLCGFHILSNPGLSYLSDHLSGVVSAASHSTAVHGAGTNLTDNSENNSHFPGLTYGAKPLTVEDGSDDDLPPSYHVALHTDKSERITKETARSSLSSRSQESSNVVFGLGDSESVNASSNLDHGSSSKTEKDIPVTLKKSSSMDGGAQASHHITNNKQILGISSSQSESALSVESDSRLRSNSDASKTRKLTLGQKAATVIEEDSQTDSTDSINEVKKKKKLKLLRPGFLKDKK